MTSYPEFRAEFPAAENLIYFDSATVALGSRAAAASYKDSVDRWVEGRFGWSEGISAADECRAGLARLIGARTEEISVQPSVSSASGLIASQFPEARSGENVVVGEQEFSSNFMPWTSLREKGYEIRHVQIGQNGPSLDDFAAQVDSRTRLLAVSAAQSATGFLADRAGLAELAHQHGARLFVDAAQAAGAVPIDVTAEGVDFMAIPSYKFMLGTRGMGYLYVRQEHLDQFGPLSPNWLSTESPSTQSSVCRRGYKSGSASQWD